MGESKDATAGSVGAIMRVDRSRPYSKAARASGVGRLSVPAHELTELNDDFLDVVSLMVHGLDKPGDVEGERIEAGVPLTIKQAARAVGVSVKRAREVAATDLFAKAIGKEVAALRNAERPRNIKTAIAIRDDEGDHSAATKAVRLKAIAAIEGKSDGGTTVNVQVNQQTNVQAISPGYVICLDEPASVDADAVTIEGEALADE